MALAVPAGPAFASNDGECLAGLAIAAGVPTEEGFRKLIDGANPVDLAGLADPEGLGAMASTWQVAAQNGDPRAQTGLGFLYEKGLGVEQDYEQAARWYRMAAGKGVSFAQAALGDLYANGLGVPPYRSEAVALWTRAAAAGEQRARVNLAISYRFGLGTARDLYRAECLLKLAAEQGDTVAQVILGDLHYQDQGAERPADFAEARNWYSRAAGAGDAAALYNLALMSFDEKKDAQTLGQSIELIRKAAEQGLPQAAAALGYAYLTGQGVEQDLAEALKWNRLAVMQKEPGALANLGAMHEHGLGVRRDLVTAYMWYDLAASFGSAEGKEGLDRLIGLLGEKQIARGRNAAEACRQAELGNC